MYSGLKKTGCAILALTCLTSIYGQFSHPECDGDVQPGDFNIEQIFSRNSGAPVTDGSMEEPLQMDFHPIVENGIIVATDIYFIQRLGAVKHYDDRAGTITEIGFIDVWGLDDNALFGIAVHPDFDNNRWLYFWYAPDFTWGQNRVLRFTRITVGSNGMLDMSTEKIIMENIGSKTDQWHSGGPMTWDSYGDLWITVGNNSTDHDPNGFSHLSRTDSTTSEEWGASNTASIRGSILRIHPDSSEAGYGPPVGPGDNFGEYWAKHFEAQGNASLAAEYRDPEKVLPEIYTKGHRSNFSLTVHPTEGWLGWAEVNFESTRDEFNLVTHPVFAGYPYFHANQERTAGHQQTFGYLQDPDAPKNESPLNSGVTDLPPATAPKYVNLYNVAITGPIYHYDRNLNSSVKFPPGFDNTWINFGFNGGMHIQKIDVSASSLAKTVPDIESSTRVDNNFFSNIPLRSPTQAKYGPDGALYILNYDGYYSTRNPSVVRVEYTGDCQLDPVPIAERTPFIPGGKSIAWTLKGKDLDVTAKGHFDFKLFNQAGQTVYQGSGKNHKVFSLEQIQSQAGISKGLYVAQVSLGSSQLSRKILF